MDHVGFNVADPVRSKAFYLAALRPLGHALLQEGEGWAMIGRAEGPRLWIGRFGAPATPVHLAWSAPDRASVRAFHAAALAAGGKDNGAPGLRDVYGPDYYAAFVIDPDGHNVEAVCRGPEGPRLAAAVPNLFVGDFARALDWYTGRLGFRTVFTYGTPAYYGHVARGAAVLALRHVDRPALDHSGGPELLSAYIETTEVGELYAAIRDGGAELFASLRAEPWGARSFIVRDPDGNLVCFSGP